MSLGMGLLEKIMTANDFPFVTYEDLRSLDMPWGAWVTFGEYFPKGVRLTPKVLWDYPDRVTARRWISKVQKDLGEEIIAAYRAAFLATDPPTEDLLWWIRVIKGNHPDVRAAFLAANPGATELLFYKAIVNKK